MDDEFFLPVPFGFFVIFAPVFSIGLAAFTVLNSYRFGVALAAAFSACSPLSAFRQRICEAKFLRSVRAMLSGPSQ